MNRSETIQMPEQHIFHIHTRRCRHASQADDRAYVEKAVEFGAESITFTDHTPFPGDPLDRRMLIAELPEYVGQLQELRREYAGTIDVKIGLEVEYMPKYHDFIQGLYESGQFDLLILGQHFSQVDVLHEVTKDTAFEGMNYPEVRRVADAIITGIRTGWFSVVAHPDRMFRRYGAWNEEMAQIAAPVIAEAVQHGLCLEINLASRLKKNFFRDEFWEMVPQEARIVIGIDAHSIVDLEYRYGLMQELLREGARRYTIWNDEVNM